MEERKEVEACVECSGDLNIQQCVLRSVFHELMIKKKRRVFDNRHLGNGVRHYLIPLNQVPHVFQSSIR